MFKKYTSVILVRSNGIASISLHQQSLFEGFKYDFAIHIREIVFYNKHEGVCLGLNMDHVAKYIKVNYGMMVTTQGQEVQYRNILHKPNYYRDREDFFSYQIFTKAKAWEHEQEVRLFIYKPSPMFMKLLPFQHDKTEFNHKEIRSFVKIGSECFESLYFGVRVDAADKEKITKLARRLNPNIKISQMEADPNAFRLMAK